MTKRKYEMGERIKSLDELVEQKAVYQYISGGLFGAYKGHWKYMNIGWVTSYQLHYVDIQLKNGNFRKVIKKGENKND